MSGTVTIAITYPTPVAQQDKNAVKPVLIAAVTGRRTTRRRALRE